MEYAMFSKGIGMGVIFHSDQEIKENILPKKANAKSGDLIPGDLTTFGNMFNRPIKYLGMLKEKTESSPCLTFEFHRESDLFETRIYCDCFFLIEPNRLFKKFTELSGRDYNFINGKWK
jgi:hypothetical protein